MSDYYSTWTLIRSSGFLAYFFMTISLSFGIISTLSIMKKQKASLLVIHQTSGWYGLLTIIFHAILLWNDHYLPYSVREILLPFTAKNEPIFSALGTISFYLFFLVIGTSDFFIKRLGRARWKKIHLAVIPAWVMLIIHGITIGTDSSAPWALFLYASGISSIMVLMIIRYFDGNRSKQLNKQTAGK